MQQLMRKEKITSTKKEENKETTQDRAYIGKTLHRRCHQIQIRMEEEDDDDDDDETMWWDKQIQKIPIYIYVFIYKKR